MESSMDKKKVKFNEWIEWKWTNGEKYEKSTRQYPRTQNQIQSQTQINYDEDEDPRRMSQLAFQQALLSENDVWSLEEQQVFVNPDKPMNKREDTYNRMAEREMVGQIGMNPFMQRNYLEDVMVQENFLKPVSTSLEREKFKDS
jgi:hypothetical protein